MAFKTWEQVGFLRKNKSPETLWAERLRRRSEWHTKGNTHAGRRRVKTTGVVGSTWKKYSKEEGVIKEGGNWELAIWFSSKDTTGGSKSGVSVKR